MHDKVISLTFSDWVCVTCDAPAIQSRGLHPPILYPTISPNIQFATSIPAGDIRPRIFQEFMAQFVSPGGRDIHIISDAERISRTGFCT